MAFNDYIGSVTMEACKRKVTLTITGTVIGDGDKITFPADTLWIEETSAAGSFGHVDNTLTLTGVASGDTVTMLLPKTNTSYLIEYYDLSAGASYFESIYLNCDEPCDDCKSCDYINHGRLYNKRISGLLQHTRYNSEHSKYMLNFEYNEDTSKIEMNDSALNTNIEGEYGFSPEGYSKYLVVTYLSYDRETGKFIEQIVYSSGINKLSEWSYDITKDALSCWYHNEGCVEVEKDFTNATVEVEYVGNDGSYLLSSKVYPLLYSNEINTEDNKRYVDGIYKSYYFMVRDIPNGTITNYSLGKGNAVRFLNTIDVMDYTLVAKDNYNISTTPTTITIGSVTFDATNITDMLDLFIVVEGTVDSELVYKPIEMLKTVVDAYQGERRSNAYLDELIAEEMHIITYELAYEILESIEDCSVPCERFSFDEWIGLRQKHLAANTHFCKGNIMKAALELYTARKRCKNC